MEYNINYTATGVESACGFRDPGFLALSEPEYVKGVTAVHLASLQLCKAMPEEIIFIPAFLSDPSLWRFIITTTP
jgi:hypothetical protein